MPQNPTDNREFDTLPDEEQFHRALSQVTSFGQQTFQVAIRLRDIINAERERSANENETLKKRIEEKDAEIESIRKSLVDLQLQLTEAQRVGNSYKIEARQLKEQLTYFAVDIKHIEDTEKQLRTARGEIADLRLKIEAITAQATKIDRDNKAELEKQALKYEQEKVLLFDNIKVAQDRAQTEAEHAERFQASVQIVEAEKTALLEELSRARQAHKEQLEKLRSELAKRDADASELQRRLSDHLRDNERQVSLARARTEQDYQSQIEKLKNDIDERDRLIKRFNYQIEQEKEYHNRAIEALKLEMAKQLDIRADEIRRQLILKKSDTNGTLE